MMIGDLFDPKRLGRRWNAEPPRVEKVVHPKLAEVVVAPDRRADAKTMLADIRKAVQRDLPAQRELLAPFLKEAEDLLNELDGKAEGVDPKDAAERALEVLWRLEDLLEIYYFLAPSLVR